MKNIRVGAIVLLTFIALVYLFKQNNGSSKKAVIPKGESNSSTIIEFESRFEEKDLEEKKVEAFQKELDLLSKPFDNSEYRGDYNSIIKELKLFNKWAKLIKENANDSSKVIIDLVKKLKAKAIALQGKEFPLMRTEFSKVTGRTAWKDNITISCTGKRKTRIHFEGHTFALNRNKLDVHMKIRDGLNYFRFKEAVYSWYEYDDEATTWTIDSPKDDVIEYSYSIENLRNQ